jgi:hypothetical protein
VFCSNSSLLFFRRFEFSSAVGTTLPWKCWRCGRQVAVLKRKRPRPRLNPWDRLFWTTLRRVWSRWTDVLIVVKPETVVGWHRAGFRLP